MSLAQEGMSEPVSVRKALKKKLMGQQFRRDKRMKKALIAIIGFYVIAALVSCLSLDFLGIGNSGSGTGSQASNDSRRSSTGSGNSGSQSNNGSRVTSARPSTARNVFFRQDYGAGLCFDFKKETGGMFRLY